MPLALLALTIGAFAIGTTEFVIVGLVPTIAEQLAISLPSAGLLVSIYALGVAIGAPVLTALTGRMPRRRKSALRPSSKKSRDRGTDRTASANDGNVPHR